MAIQPNMLLFGTFTVNSENAYWNDDDGSGDPFIGFPYRWEIVLNIQSQAHSSPSTRTPFEYNGLDLEVEDWIAGGSGGMSLQIVSIISASTNSVTCIVEDTERFNLFSNPLQNGIGIFPEGNFIAFKIGDDGLPLLGPVPDGFIDPSSINDLEARFLAVNSDEFVLVKQVGHGMNVGDLIYADPVNLGGYLKTDALNISNAVGIVTRINVPGLDYFNYRPLGNLITRVSPPLAGVHGTIYYADPNNAGKLTSTKPLVNARPIYMRLDKPDRAILIARPAESSSNSGMETNKYDVTSVTAGQTTFTLPSDVVEVLYMSINGIENENFTFNSTTKVLEFDPVLTGYGIDIDDEIFFIYKS